jgi:hypothetical protein
MDISSFKPGAHAAMTAAKKAALDAMMSETEKAVAEFKEDYPKELATRTLIEEFVAQRIDGKVNATHLTHAITRAGLINTARRIRKGDDNPKLHSIVIVRGDWTAAIIKRAAAERLQEKIDWDWEPM